jgi:hypothetical protein
MQVKCPYCNRDAEFMTSELYYGTDYGTNVYACRRCDASVGTYGRSKKPMGPLASAELRQVRMRAHSVFDLMWQKGDMTRSAAYQWLAQKLKIPPAQAHIGMFSAEQAEEATLHAIRFYLTTSEYITCPDCQGSGDMGRAYDLRDYLPCNRCEGEGMIQRGDIRTSP